MVLLQHVLSTGESHYDWLIERPSPVGVVSLATSPDDRCLLALRVHVRIDDRECTAFQAEAMPDHRLAYLTFEGMLPPGPQGESRGAVKRVAGGVVRAVRASDGMLSVRARWTNGSPSRSLDEWTWAGVSEGDGRWRFLRGSKSFARPTSGRPDPDANPGVNRWGMGHCDRRG